MVYCLKVFCFLSFASLVSFTGFSTEEKPGKECASSAGGSCVSGLFIVMRKLDAFSFPNVGLFLHHCFRRKKEGGDSRASGHIMLARNEIVFRSAFALVLFQWGRSKENFSSS